MVALQADRLGLRWWQRCDEGADVSDQVAGRWLVWGAGTSADVLASALGGLGSALASAISSLKPVSLDDNSAADTGPAAVIREQDPDWTRPAAAGPISKR
jgi:hypothetical protein